MDREKTAMCSSPELLFVSNGVFALHRSFFEREGAAMSLRPLNQIPQHVLTPLVLVCLERHEIARLVSKEDQDLPLARLVQDLHWQIKADGVKAHMVEERLDSVLKSFSPTGDSISTLSPGLSDAYRSQDPLLLSAILWHVCRQPGLAWRKAEVRILAALMVFVLSSASLHRGGGVVEAWIKRSGSNGSSSSSWALEMPSKACCPTG